MALLLSVLTLLLLDWLTENHYGCTDLDFGCRIENTYPISIMSLLLARSALITIVPFQISGKLFLLPIVPLILPVCKARIWGG